MAIVDTFVNIYKELYDDISNMNFTQLEDLLYENIQFYFDIKSNK